jgi:glycosyltransferase involved in cell wall biosynthesis
MLNKTENPVLVSVVMPVYNVEAFVAEAIESVLAQSLTNFELLIINDCSPDTSLNICQQFCDPRIRIINHTSNRGLAGARNTGVENARGEFIAFIDSDDAWHPHKLRLHIDHLQHNPHVGLSFSRSEFMLADSSKTGYHQMPRLVDISPTEILCRNPVGNGSAPVVRRMVFAQIAYADDLYGESETFYFDARLRQSEDIECWLRIALKTSWQIEGLAQALTYYRLNESGLSSSLFKQYESWESVIQSTRRYAPEFIAQSEQRARAYQLRYLARQAIRLRDGNMAVSFLHKALRTDAAILIQEPARSLATMSAAYLMSLMPQKLYLGLESVGSKIVSKLQKIRIHRDMQSIV